MEKVLFPVGNNKSTHMKKCCSLEGTTAVPCREQQKKIGRGKKTQTRNHPYCSKQLYLQVSKITFYRTGVAEECLL